MQQAAWRYLDGNQHESIPVTIFPAAAPVAAPKLRESPIL
jgi:hypothetical protein